LTAVIASRSRTQSARSPRIGHGAGYWLKRVAIALVVGAVMQLAGPARAKPGPDGFADLAAKLLPSVVNISTTQTIKSD
jgi:serine protease Do